MNRQDSGDNLFRLNTGKRQKALLVQFVKVAATLHSIDELFTWLAHATVHYFDVQVMQFWASQAYRNGQIFTEVRTTACQDTSLPQQFITNNHVATLAGQLMQEQTNFMLSSVQHVFSHHQASLLARYGLLYCSGYILRSSALLPPATDRGEKVPTPLEVVALLFLHQPRPHEWQAEFDYTFRQALQYGETHGLLLSPAAMAYTPPGYQPASPLHQSPVSLQALIPKRKEDANLLITSNPFAGGASPIGDKEARRLYAAIDGHKNVAELSSATHMTLGEAYKALQKLLAESRIQLYGPDGQLIESSQLPGNY